MNIHYLQHVPFEGLGSIHDWVKRRGHTLRATHFYRGDALPVVETLDLLLVMGGPMNIYEEASYPWLKEEKRFIEQAIATGRHELGICLGAQLVADALGAKVYANADKEIGWFPVERTQATSGDCLFAALHSRLEVFHWHADTFDIPSGAVHAARSAGCAHQAFVYDERVVGLQFHLETTPASARQINFSSLNMHLPAISGLGKTAWAFTLYFLYLVPTMAQAASEGASSIRDCKPNEVIKFRGGTARLENDLFAETDQNYTNGVVKFGQSMFTPKDPARTDLILDDRPYAGLLYVDMS